MNLKKSTEALKEVSRDDKMVKIVEKKVETEQIWLTLADYFLERQTCTGFTET